MPDGSEIIEVEEDTTMNIGNSGYTVMVGDGPVNTAKQKGKSGLVIKNDKFLVSDQKVVFLRSLNNLI